jgi:hypothetical protein
MYTAKSTQPTVKTPCNPTTCSPASLTDGSGYSCETSLLSEASE